MHRILRRPWLVFLLFIAGASPALAAEVKLGWTYPADGTRATSFNVYRQDACLGEWRWVANPPEQVRVWIDTQVETGRTYCYQLTALGDMVGTGREETEPSNILACQVPCPPPAPLPLPVPRRLRRVR